MARPAARRASGAIAVTLLLLLLPAPASSQVGAVVGAIARSPFFRKIGDIIIQEVATAGVSALTDALKNSKKGGQLGSDAADDAGIILYNVAAGEETFSVMVDIFNDFLWVQCPPAQVPAFSAVPCGSQTCSRALKKTVDNCVNKTGACQYVYVYGSGDEGTRSTGYLAYESFTFGVDTDTSPISGSVVFGCSTNTTVKLDGAIGPVQQGPPLLPLTATHLKVLILFMFSYFLTPDDSKSSGSTSVVLLGEQAVAQTNHSHSTPLLSSKAYPDLYYVKLTGIQVDGESLKGIPAGAFDLAANGSGGVALSTTIPVTWLQSDAYYAVRQALMSKIKSEPVNSSGTNAEGFDLCYNTNSVAKLEFPKITLVFDGPDSPGMELTTVHYFYKERRSGLQCLTMMPMPADRPFGSILGRMLQAGTNMIYDVAGRRLTFEKAAAAPVPSPVPLMAIVSLLLVWVLVF
ncbi:unnamed protein product [Alopecurus aequalis]